MLYDGQGSEGLGVGMCRERGRRTARMRRVETQEHQSRMEVELEVGSAEVGASVVHVFVCPCPTSP